MSFTTNNFLDEESNELIESGFDGKHSITRNVNDDFQNDITMFQNENELNKYKLLSKKKKEKKKRKEDRKATVARKIVNLPASQPYIRVVDGEERLCFKYNTKVSESAKNAMPKNELEDYEFCVRFDLDSVDISKLSEKFKSDNVIYPRANIPKEQYTGNRWQYETECNKLAWQFVSLNHVILYGKKGLIQRAVDSYRKYNKQSRNRRMGTSKENGDIDGMIKRKHSDSCPKTTIISYIVRGLVKKCRIRIDIEDLKLEDMENDFKWKYSVYPEFFDEYSFGKNYWEVKN
ncbi:hypothetical protein H311_03179, partial [Anncaliia algerae PRA109]